MADIALDIQVPPSTEEVIITATGGVGEGALAVVRSIWSPPLTRPRASGPAAWGHAGRSEQPLDLAEMPGRCTGDTFEADGLQMRRDVWVADTGAAVAMRYSLVNRGDEAIHLETLCPLQCEGPDSVLVRGQGAESWDVLAHKRFKNDGPTAFRPGVFDDDYEMTQKPVSNTGELAVDEVDEQSWLIRMDQLCMLRPRGATDSPALMVGYLSQQGHMARLLMRFRTDDEGTRLEQMSAECEFDAVRVDAGEERTGQWVLIAAGETNRLIAEYADRVGVYHGVPRPTEPAPSVFCSFYTYGEYYAEKYLDEDLEDLAARPVPFDAIIIDGGWEQARGDWEPREDWWPSGMKAVADKIADHGYRPALWTGPFVAAKRSKLAQEHPDWLLKLEDGEHKEFTANEWALDPTCPGVCEWLEETFRKMTFEWGYHYHKLDFTRAVFSDPRSRFHDPAATRLEAYQMGLEAIRRGAGPDAYISVCGGHYGGALGVAQTQRSGSDVRSWWEMMKPRVKQNVLRAWLSRLCQVDPDAMVVRRRDKPILDTPHGQYSLGRLSDEEAEVIALNQYLSGGVVCLAEKFRELDEDRRALYRHVIPSSNCAAVPLDPFEPVGPSFLATRVQPRCADLEAWNTLAAINWHDEPRSMTAVLEGEVIEGMAADRYLVSEFFSQEVLGLFAPGDRIDLGSVDPHNCRLLRLAPWNGKTPVLAGTDLHCSGGAVEVAAWSAETEEVSGHIETRWDYPTRVSVAFPTDSGFRLGTATVGKGGGRFEVVRPG